MQAHEAALALLLAAWSLLACSGSTSGVPAEPGPPGSPAGVSATADIRSADVTWLAPADDGGSPITGYTVTASPGGATATTSGALTATVAGLSNGTTYTFTVVAANAHGSGGASAPSDPVTTPDVPGAPASVSALPGNAAAVVSWDPPAQDGGRPITQYVVTASPSGAERTTSGTSILFSGLADLTPHTFTVVAQSAVGPGPAATSPAATPAPGTLATGVLVDSRTCGVRFASGGLEGTTSADGTFRYVEGAQVRFQVGDVLLGEAAGASVVTPVQLQGATSASDPAVVTVARFLQTLDADADPSNGIVVPATADAVARGEAFSVDLGSLGEAELALLLESITPNEVVASVDAEAHVTANAQAIWAGTYSGTFSGAASGTWRVTIAASGAISGTSSDGLSSYAVAGSIDTSGGFTFTGTGTAGPAEFVGTLDSGGHANGSWSAVVPVPPELGGGTIVVAGSFTGSRSESTFAGHYVGTYTGGDQGSWDVTVDGAGSVSGTGYSALLSASFAVTGSVSGTGALSFAASGVVSTGAAFSGAIYYDGRTAGQWSGPAGFAGTFEGARQ